MSTTGTPIEARLGALAVRLPRRYGARVALATLLFLAIVAPYVVSQLTKPSRLWLIDLTVYRDAGRAVLDGGRDLYRFDTPVLHLPFTYPPFPALLSSWLAVLPRLAAGLVWTAGELATVVALAAFLFRPVLRRTEVGRPFLLAALAGALFWLDPVREVVKFGQVDLFLVGLVLADCATPRPRWPRGVLIGIATAVKLTPGLFVPYLWLSGRRRAAAVAAGTFVAAEGVAQLVIPAGSRDYWTRALFASDRLGSNAGTSNQSIRGMLLRLHTDPHVTTALWLTLAIVVLVAGFARALAASRSGNECAAVAIVGLVGVAISPVSWIHHLAWVLVAVAVLAGDFRDRTRIVAAVGLGAYFAFRLPWWGNAVSVHHGPLYPTRLVQDAFGLAVLALLFVLPWRELVAGRTGQPLAEIAAVSGRVRPGRERTRGAGSMTVGGGSRAGG